MTGNSEQSIDPTDADSGGRIQTLDTPSNESPSQSQTAVHDVLADGRRRSVLRQLAETQTPTALTDLAVEIAARETDRSVADVSEAEMKRVRSSLWHAHVPKLADAGVVDCDRQRKMVSLTASAERIEPYLEPRSTE